MATKVVTQLVDDFDGKELEPGDGETVRVTLEGAEYELDLSAKNAQRLRDDFGKWLDHARKVSSSGGRGKGRSSASTTTRDYDPKTVRSWAESNGIDVPARGRIPASVLAEFKAAGN